jgi:hypothetical protein
MNRDAVIGARLDKPGVRLSFVLVVLLLIAAMALSVTLFLQSLQFFDPDYTRFALSLVPLFVLAWASFQLRPRNHLTVMISDGSALLLTSGDGNFLAMCLEAFERLWADKSRARASLYLHAAHRSVDFGPSGAGLLDAAAASSINDPLPPMPELPMFDDDDRPATDSMGTDANPKDGGPEENIVLEAVLEEAVDDALSPVPTVAQADVISGEEVTLPPPLPVPDIQIDASKDDVAVAELSAADLLGADGETEDVARVEPVLTDVPTETKLDEDADRLDAVTAGKDMFVLSIEPEAAEPDPVPVELEEPAGPFIEPAVFDPIRAKVGTLSRLLRDRADFAELIDAVDVMDHHIEAGCQTRAEAEALAAAITTMRTPLAVYPAALQVVEAVAEAGELDRFASAEPSDA